MVITIDDTADTMLISNKYALCKARFMEVHGDSNKPWSRVTRQRHYNEISVVTVSLYGSDVTSVRVVCGNTRCTTVSILGLRITEDWPDFSGPLYTKEKIKSQTNKNVRWRPNKSATLRRKDDHSYEVSGWGPFPWNLNLIFATDKDSLTFCGWNVCTRIIYLVPWIVDWYRKYMKLAVDVIANM